MYPSMKHRMQFQSVGKLIIVKSMNTLNFPFSVTICTFVLFINVLAYSISEYSFGLNLYLNSNCTSVSNSYNGFPWAVTSPF